VILAIEPTSWIVAAVFLLTILGAAYGLKTRKGSGINDHPDSTSQDPARDAGVAGEGSITEEDRPDSTLLDQHGEK
jgi:hypothetical protein